MTTSDVVFQEQRPVGTVGRGVLGQPAGAGPTCHRYSKVQLSFANPWKSSEATNKQPVHGSMGHWSRSAGGHLHTNTVK